MEIVNSIKYDIARRSVSPAIDAVQGEVDSRVIELSVFSNGTAVNVEGYSCSLAFSKPDGTSGWYDTMPDKSTAFSVSGNVISMKIAPQVLAVPGEVNAVIRFETSGKTERATTFPFVISVSKDPAINATKSENYYSVQNWDQVNSQISELTDELANRPTYYGSVDPAQYDYLVSKLVEPGYYGVDSTWKDVPANSSFAIRVYKYTKNYVIQIAQDIRSSASFIRVVKINDNSIYTDWTSSTDTCLEYRQIPSEIIDEKLCSKIVKTGVYGVSSNIFADIPYGTYTLMVYQYTPNWVMQILVGVYSGITYNRIVNKDTTEVLRDWMDNEGRDPISILCVGDSIAYGARNGGKGFVGDLGYKYLNAAVSGATISNAREDKTNIPDQLISAEDYEPTVIIAEGGINDYLRDVPLGEIPKTIVTKDEDANLFDRNTVIGAVHFLVYNMVKLYPKAQKFFLFIHKTVYYSSNHPNGFDCTNTKNSAGYTQTELFDAIRKVCALYNIKIIDVFNKSVINPAFDQYRSTIPYSEDNSVTDREFVDYDGLHPLAYGYLNGYVPIVKQALQGGGEPGDFNTVVDALSDRLANGSVTLVDEREGVTETLFLERDNLRMTVRDKVETVLSTGYQHLTEEQKAQARNNIGAASVDDVIQRTEYSGVFVDDDITSTLTFEKGYYYGTNGKVTDANGNVHCTNLIPVKTGDKFKITTTYGYAAVLVAEFDSTQTMVSYHGLNNDGAVNVTDYEYTVPSGISYIAINNRYQESSPMVIKKVVVDSVKHRIAELEKSGGGGAGTPGKDGKDGITPEFSIGEVETLPAGSEATATVTGTKENPVLNLGIPKGEDGKDGTGGTGEIPSALPNPQKLTFTGAVNAEYDGSEAVEVEIPAGGGGGDVVEDIDVTYHENERYILFPVDNNPDGHNLSVKRSGNVVEVIAFVKILSPAETIWTNLLSGLPPKHTSAQLIVPILSRTGGGPMRVELTDNGVLRCAGGEATVNNDAKTGYDVFFTYLAK